MRHYYYLTPYVGTGRAGDPFRPHVDTDRMASIDLRPDATRRDGYALVTTPEPQRGLLHLGDEPGARSGVVRRLLGNRLGVGLRRDTLPQHAAALLLEHAREDGTRWKPLRPAGWYYEIWLGGLLWRMPILAGGATVTEAWPTNSTTISSGQNQPWTEVLNDMQVTGGVIAPVTLGDNCRARCEVDLATANNYAQQVIITWTAPSASLNLFELCCRYSAAADTCYFGGYVHGAVGPVHRREIQRLAAGASTVILQEDGITQAVVGQTIRLEADGSTLRVRNNGVALTVATDTVITTGTRGGIMLRNNEANRVQGDSFEMGDLAYPRVRAMAHYRRRRAD
jgi:hypothetical protein